MFLDVPMSSAYIVCFLLKTQLGMTKIRNITAHSAIPNSRLMLLPSTVFCLISVNLFNCITLYGGPVAFSSDKKNNNKKKIVRRSMQISLKSKEDLSTIRKYRGCLVSFQQISSGISAIFPKPM